MSLDIQLLNSRLMAANVDFSSSAQAFLRDHSPESLQSIAASGFMLFKPTAFTLAENSNVADIPLAYSTLARLMAISDLANMVFSFCLTRKDADRFMDMATVYVPSGKWDLTFPARVLDHALGLGQVEAMKGHLTLARA